MSDQITALSIFNNTLGHNNSDGIGLLVVSLQIADGIILIDDAKIRVNMGSPGSIGKRSIIALLDTGAEACHIDAALAEDLNLPKTGAFYEMTGVTGHAAPAAVHDVHLWFPEAHRIYKHEMLATDFSKSPWKVMLGMQFIRDVELSIHIKGGTAFIRHL